MLYGKQKKAYLACQALTNLIKSGVFGTSENSDALPEGLLQDYDHFKSVEMYSHFRELLLSNGAIMRGLPDHLASTEVIRTLVSQEDEELRHHLEMIALSLGFHKPEEAREPLSKACKIVESRIENGRPLNEQ